MMNNKFLRLVLLLTLLFSCQEKYNKVPFDEKEEKLRKYPNTLKTLMIDSLWQKRDSLTYLRFKDLEQVYLVETDSIPKWITQFHKLKVIYCSNYKKEIKSIPKDIGKLTNLTKIDLPRNNISKLPESFYKLKNLEIIDFSSNKINLITDEIGNLKKIKLISIGKNPIEVLALCGLQNLENLSINNTNFKEIPLCISKLNRISSIDISNTKISHLPIEILSLPNLKNIGAKGIKLDNYKEVKEICKKRNIAFYYDE